MRRCAIMPELTTPRQGPSPGSRCLCGSGRRFEACCLPLERREGQLRHRILHFAHSPRHVRARRAAEAAFWPDGRVDESDGEGIAFLTYFTMDHRLASGDTIVGDFVKTERLSAKDREIVASIQRGRWGLFEVRAVEPGAFVKVRDVFTQEDLELRDVSASRGLSKWDVIYTRIIPGRGAWVGDGSLLRGAPDQLLPLVGALERLGAKRGEPHTPETLSRVAAQAYNAVLGVLHEPAFEAVLTYEGDPIVIATTILRVKDPIAFAETIEELPDFYPAGVDEDEKLCINWAVPEETLPQKELPDDARAVRIVTHLIPNDRDAKAAHAARLLNLGMISISLNGRVEVECLSVERRRTLLARLEATGIPMTLLEERSRPVRADEIGHGGEDLDAPTEARARGGISKREQARMRRALADDFIETWPRTPIPALGGLTPIEAARMPERRPELVQLLKSIAHRADDPESTLRPREVARLAREIGLPDALKR